MSARHGETRFGSYPSPVPARPCSIAPPLIQFSIGSDTVHHSIQSGSISGKILFSGTMSPILQGDHTDQPASWTFHPYPSVFSFHSGVYDSTVRTISFKYLPTIFHFFAYILLDDLRFSCPLKNVPLIISITMRVSEALQPLFLLYGAFSFLFCGK